MKSCTIGTTLSSEFGNSIELNRELKRQIRLAEDLINLADEKKIGETGNFVKEVFNPVLDLNALAADEIKI